MRRFHADWAKEDERKGADRHGPAWAAPTGNLMAPRKDAAACADALH
jgi:hypothetical protein